MGSQFWDLDFTQGASHDPGPGIFFAHDFQDMDGEPGNFTVSEGHGHPLVHNDWSRRFAISNVPPTHLYCLKICGGVGKK